MRYAAFVQFAGIKSFFCSADDADARIARAIRICVGDYVREMYGEVLKEPIPPRIAKLLRRLDRQGVQSERG